MWKSTLWQTGYDLTYWKALYSSIESSRVAISGHKHKSEEGLLKEMESLLYSMKTKIAKKVIIRNRKEGSQKHLAKKMLLGESFLIHLRWKTSQGSTVFRKDKKDKNISEKLNELFCPWSKFRQHTSKYELQENNDRRRVCHLLLEEIRDIWLFTVRNKMLN